MFLLVLKSFLSPVGARSHPRCQDLFPEGPNLHEVITKRENLSTLPRGNGVGGGEVVSWAVAEDLGGDHYLCKGPLGEGRLAGMWGGSRNV